MRLIWTCRCSGVEPYAVAAYKGMYPEIAIPKIVKGRDILKESVPPILSRTVEAICRKRGRYAYFLEWSESGDGHIVNLLTGRVLA